MRPIGEYGAATPAFGLGAFTPHDYVAQNQTQQNMLDQPKAVIVPSGIAPPPSVEPAYGTFKDISGAPSWSPLGRPLWTGWKNRRLAPLAIIPLQPRISGIDLQVTNPDARYKMPGYTSDVPVSLAGEIARALRQPYMKNQGV